MSPGWNGNAFNKMFWYLYFHSPLISGLPLVNWDFNLQLTLRDGPPPWRLFASHPAACKGCRRHLLMGDQASINHSSPWWIPLKTASTSTYLFRMCRQVCPISHFRQLAKLLKAKRNKDHFLNKLHGKAIVFSFVLNSNTVVDQFSRKIGHRKIFY